MQFIGTDLFRNQLNANVWINIVIDKINNNKDQKYVITDIRFDNEAEELIKLGTIIINIQRNTEIVNNGHVSENSLTIKPNFIIDNNCSLTSLYKSIDNIITN